MKLYEMELKSSLGVRSKWYSWNLSDLQSVINDHTSRGFALYNGITFVNKKVPSDHLEFLEPTPWYIIKGIHY